MHKYLNQKNIKIETFDNVENIMYEDEYQIIEKRWELSITLNQKSKLTLKLFILSNL